MYTGSTTASFTRAQLNNWEGFQPSKDWAIFFELRRPSSDIALITLHDGTHQGHPTHCRPGSINYGGNGKRIDFSWYIGNNSIFFDGPILNSDEYLQLLVSYNKTGYEAGGGGTEPDVTSPSILTLPDYVHGTYNTVPYSSWTNFRYNKPWAIRFEIKQTDNNNNNGRNIFCSSSRPNGANYSHATMSSRYEPTVMRTEFWWVVESWDTYLGVNFPLFELNKEYDFYFQYSGTLSHSSFSAFRREKVGGIWGQWSQLTVNAYADNLNALIALDTSKWDAEISSAGTNEGISIGAAGVYHPEWKGDIKNIQFYNSGRDITGYVAGTDPTTLPKFTNPADRPGLSYYYRHSSTSTFNNSWTHATPSFLYDSLDESATFPSDYTTYVGRNYNSTNGLDGNGYLTNIKLWNQTLSTSDL